MLAIVICVYFDVLWLNSAKGQKWEGCIVRALIAVVVPVAEQDSAWTRPVWKR